MSKLRKSARLSNGPIKDEMIIIIKNREDGRPAEPIADVKTSIIQYMCNKCNKKYTTTLGLKRHLKFCNDSSSDISLTMPDITGKNNINLSENHNDFNSKNFNITEPASKHVYSPELKKTAPRNDNPYEFEDELSDDNPDDHTISELNPELCACCGESILTAHKVCWCL